MDTIDRKTVCIMYGAGRNKKILEIFYKKHTESSCGLAILTLGLSILTIMLLVGRLITHTLGIGCYGVVCCKR